MNAVNSISFSLNLNSMWSETAVFAPSAATWQTGRNIRVVFDSSAFAPLYENFTPSTHPQNRKYINIAWPTEKDRATAACNMYRILGEIWTPDAMLARYTLSSCVCLSVYMSVWHKPVLYKTAKRRIMQTTPYDSPGILVFWSQRSRRNANGVTPTGAPNRSRGGVGYNRRFMTNISCRYAHHNGA